MDLIIRQFEESLIKFVNASPLSIEIKRLVMKEVLRMVEERAEAIIKDELNKETEDGISKLSDNGETTE